MPVYEYECNSCKKVFEVQQRIADQPLSTCPECSGALKKLVSVSSFQLKGGGWYADGYASNGAAKGASKASSSETSSAPACPSGGCCAGCSASSAT